MNNDQAANLCQCAAHIARANPDVSAMYISDRLYALQRLAGSLKRLAEHDCNFGCTEAQEARRERLDAKAAAIAGELGCGYEPMHDVRGYAVKLILPGGQTNSIAGRVWGIF